MQGYRDFYFKILFGIIGLESDNFVKRQRRITKQSHTIKYKSLKPKSVKSEFTRDMMAGQWCGLGWGWSDYQTSTTYQLYN